MLHLPFGLRQSLLLSEGIFLPPHCNLQTLHLAGRRLHLLWHGIHCSAASVLKMSHLFGVVLGSAVGTRTVA